MHSSACLPGEFSLVGDLWKPGQDPAATAGPTVEKSVSLQTVAHCLEQTEMWMRSRFNSLAYLKGLNLFLDHALVSRQQTFQNVRRILSSSVSLPEEDIHYSPSVFKSCSSGILVRKRNCCCQMLRKIETYSVLEKYNIVAGAGTRT